MVVDQQVILEFLETSYHFRKFDAGTIQSIARNLTAKNLSPGQILYRQGMKSGALYLILSGHIKLSVTHGKNRVEVSTISAGGVVGLEASTKNQVRLTNAAAIQGATLLCLEKGVFIDLCRTTPTLSPSFTILLDSLQLSIKKDLRWIKPGETVMYLARRHPVYLLLRLVPPLLLIIPLILLLRYTLSLQVQNFFPWLIFGVCVVTIIAWMTWYFLDWLNDTAIITNQRVVFQESILLLYDSRVESPLNQILSISIETSQLGRLCSYGDIIVRTYTSRVTLPSVAHPWQVADFLEWSRTSFQSRQSQLPLNEMEEELKKRLGLKTVYDHADDPAELEVVEKYYGTFSERINHLFHLRYEKGGSIVYRKHWFILLKQIILPSVLLLLINLIFLGQIFGLATFLSFQAILALTIPGNIILAAWWLYEYLDWTNDLYIVSRDQIIDVNKKPLGREERKEAPIKNILSIDFERLGFIGLLFNFGTVYIRVGDSDLTFDYVSNPSEVQRELFYRLAEQINWSKWDNLQDDQQSMADWIETYHRIVEGKDYQSERESDKSGRSRIG